MSILARPDVAWKTQSTNHNTMESVIYVHVTSVVNLEQEKYFITRLLGRLQPQMYPPVPKISTHFIYMPQGTTNILK